VRDQIGFKNQNDACQKSRAKNRNQYINMALQHTKVQKLVAMVKLEISPKFTGQQGSI
jgi:hypothetical protein